MADLLRGQLAAVAEIGQRSDERERPADVVVEHEWVVTGPAGPGAARDEVVDLTELRFDPLVTPPLHGAP